MKRNMMKWLEDVIASERKWAVPILGFPIAQKMGLTVTELLQDADTQAKGMKIIADTTPVWAVLSFMDLSVEAEAFGAPVGFADDEVPNVLKHIVNNRADAEALQVPEVGAARTQIYIDSVAKAVKLIDDKPLFAGCIGPYSLAGRLMEMTDLMTMCMRDPETVKIVLEKVTEFAIKYAQAYKDAGANGIAMAEPLAGLLSPKMTGEFSSVYVKRIIDAVQDENFLVIYHNCGNATIKSIDRILESGALAYSFGNAIDMKTMMSKLPENVVAMGNVDPAVELCNGTPASIREATLKVMSECCEYKNFVIASGCDIPAHTPWENMDAFFNAIEEFYANK